MSEIEDLQGEKAKALNELQQQGELNKSLKEETREHKKSYKELEQEMHTKNELVNILISITFLGYDNPERPIDNLILFLPMLSTE